MRISKNGNSVHMEMDFWLNDDGSIYLTSNEVEGFQIAVNADPDRKNGHPSLYRRLAKCLSQMGAPAPKISKVE
jgi:hypothetical protein